MDSNARAWERQVKVDDSRYLFLCPDCRRRLSKSGVSGKMCCDTSPKECLVIAVTYGRGKHSREIIRITRAARARQGSGSVASPRIKMTGYALEGPATVEGSGSGPP